jgi:hypothetical protein
MRIGVGLSIPELSTRGGRAFSPLSLFADGAKGAWYAPDDFSTLFQDSAGTTAVTAVEQPVGLMLDKSQGLVLGSELLTNGDFANSTTGWTIAAAGTAVVTSGIVRITSISGRATISQALTTVVGQQYRVDLGSISNGNAGAGAAIVRITSTNSYSGTLITSVGSASSNGLLFFTATTTTTYIWLAENTATASNYVEFGGLSVKSDSGNHAPQATSASRPILRARYNLLTYSEAMATSYGTFFSTFTNTALVTTPSGAPTSLLTPNTTNNSHGVNFASTLGPGTFTYSFEVKANGYPRIGVRVYDGTAYRIYVTVDISSGLVVGTPTGTVTITDLGSGWWRISIVSVASTGSMGTVAGWAIESLPAANTVQTSFIGDGVSGAYLSKADIRYGSSAGTYQRIAAATDYDTVGFLPYLALDGTDDSFGTGSIDFSATDKMFVCAGLTKLNTSAAFNCLIESGVTATNGFSIFAPDSSNNNYSFWLKTQSRPVAQNYAAPITNVISVSQNTAAATVALQTKPRINGADIAQTGVTLAAATNFANEALYIGRRGGSTLPFNGRIYQMVVCGKTLSADELASTEAYVNARTGAY